MFVDGGVLSGLVFLDCVDDLSVRSFFVPGLSSLYVISPEVSRLSSLKIKELTLEQCLSSKTAAHRLLGKVCFEGKCHLLHIAW